MAWGVADHRLRRNADFQRVRQEGRSLANRWLVLNVAPNDLTQSRVGFAIGKRLGGAVVRNRLKRRLREIVRAHRTAGRLRPGYDLIIVGRSAAATAEWAPLCRAVDDLLQRAGLLVPAGEEAP